MARLSLLLSLFIVCCTITGIDAATVYHGKKVGSFTTKDHLVAADIYAVDNGKLRLVDFSYDGSAPDAFFWIGLKSNATDAIDAKGIPIPDEAGSTTKLREYVKETIVLTLPDSIKVTDIKWISVWCKLVGVNFGHLSFPSSFVPPAPLDIGEFSRLAHQVRSGVVTILDSRTFFIRDLHYDGGGPDAFFWVGTGTNTHVGKKIPDETMRTAKLKAYSGQDITLRLPKEYTVFDIDFLSMYCIQATSDFGHVKIPENPNIPAYLSDSDMSLQNCESVHENMHVSWQVSGEDITIELSGQIDPGQYMSFGLSGSDSRTSMDDADVTVAWYTEGRQPRIVDYFMTSRSQCSNGVGVCPDDTQGGKEDSVLVSSRQVDGVTTIRYKRKLNTTDSKDLVYRTDREQYLDWAIGPINPDGLAQKHTLRVSGNLKWNFGRTAAKNCPDFVPKKSPDVKGWKEQSINGKDTTEFTVEIGQAGGARGYKSITGRASWGIAFYINKLLIPVISVERKKTYKFIIKSGNDTSNLAEYHPFYITDDANGGYAQLTAAERGNVKVYAGIGQDGKPNANAVGPLCEWEHMSNDQSATKNTFEEFFKTLKRVCKPGTPGEFMWTPDENTPDTVYYQCYQHRYLGWKIRVSDNLTSHAPTARLDKFIFFLACTLLWKVLA